MAKVILNSMTVKFGGEGEDTPADVFFDKGDLENAESKPVPMNGGVEYRMTVNFTVMNEILSGLRLHLVYKRKNITSDKETYMVGSYGPKEGYTYTVKREAPKGMMHRGAYNVNCRLIDDDQIVQANWDWIMEVGR